MDVEHLILLVSDRRKIYDPQEAKHRERNFISSLWKEITDELATDGKYNILLMYFFVF
jgi:hypothetical protein